MLRFTYKGSITPVTDLFTHLVDAPLANIFILAGLAFLGIAVLGKITGKIEPDKSGRIMSGVLGIVLLVSGVYAHVASDTKRNGTVPGLDQHKLAQIATAGSKTASGETASGTNGLFAGTWTNDNPQTRGIRRLEIEQSGGSVQVHAWAAPIFGPDMDSAMSPTGGGKGALIGMAADSGSKVDWGIQSGTINAGSVTVSWNQESVVRNMTITPDGKRLRVVVDNVYKNNRPTRQLQEYFVKSL